MPAKEGVFIEGKFRRFGIYRILEHQLAMITFAVLVVTGLSQKFHEYNLSQWIILTLGGVDSVRLIHRYTGLIFAVMTVFHIFVASVGLVFRKWQATMVINRKDAGNHGDKQKGFYRRYRKSEILFRCNRSSGTMRPV
jgi:cytochrome b subunit of formate dehydrogenase